jgi:hypothetical protein
MTDRQRAYTCDQDFAKRDLRRRAARTRHIAEESIERSVGVCLGVLSWAGRIEEGRRSCGWDTWWW